MVFSSSSPISAAILPVVLLLLSSSGSDVRACASASPWSSPAHLPFQPPSCRLFCCFFHLLDQTFALALQLLHGLLQLISHFSRHLAGCFVASFIFWIRRSRLRFSFSMVFSSSSPISAAILPVVLLL